MARGCRSEEYIRVWEGVIRTSLGMDTRVADTVMLDQSWQGRLHTYVGPRIRRNYLSCDARPWMLDGGQELVIWRVSVR